jgi:murein DD-endopeptidase MepM/ murein hydrolase activator NlpD
VAITKEEIPFETVDEVTADLPQGNAEVVQSGATGEREVTRELQKVNGEVVKSTELKAVTLSEPVTQKRRVGSGLPFAGGNYGKLGYPMSSMVLSDGFGAGRAHTGIDLTNPVGTPIMAAESGVIAESGWSGTYGILIRVDHGGGVETRYAHLNESYVSPGQRVSKGQIIGTVGMTGNTTGPHLHFEVCVGGVAQDPSGWL